MNTKSRTATIGARWTRKSLKPRSARLPMMMLGGSPMSVDVPPMLLAITSASRNGTGSRASRSQQQGYRGDEQDGGDVVEERRGGGRDHHQQHHHPEGPAPRALCGPDGEELE